MKPSLLSLISLWSAVLYFLINPGASGFSARPFQPDQYQNSGSEAHLALTPKKLQALGNVEPILGRKPNHGATKARVSLEWCKNNVSSILPADDGTLLVKNEADDPTGIMATTTLSAFDMDASVHILKTAWSRAECESIIQSANDRNQWSTSRHHLYPTTDVPVAELPTPVRDACLSLACGYILPALACIFYTPLNELHFKDMFVAKYTTTRQSGLAEHTDGSAFSFNVLLSQNADEGGGGDFEGGGTSFCNIGRVQPSQGHVLVHRGSLLHQGNPVTKGTRYILVGFVHSHPRFVDIVSSSKGSSTTSSNFFVASIASFPLGLVLEGDEGDGFDSAAIVVACHKGSSAFDAGIRQDDCIRGVFLNDNNNDTSRLEPWDGKTFDQIIARLGELSREWASNNSPLELVLERWTIPTKGKET